MRYGSALGFERRRRSGVTGGGATGGSPTLQVLTLSANSIAENSVAGTVVGAIQNGAIGSAKVLTADGGGRFAISAGNIVAGATSTDYETATFHDITIIETLAGAIGSPKATTIRIFVTDVFEPGALTIVSAPSIAGDMVVGQRLSAVRGTYNQVPDGFTNSWYFDGAPIAFELDDNYLVVDTDLGHTITFGEIAHKASYADSPLNMSA